MTGTPSRALSRTLAGAALLLSLAGCGGDRATFEKAPVILISIDTLRSDRLPAYGYDGVETPALDALRADSVLFERAYSHVPLTLPSHASILSGVLPPEHGVRDNSGYTFAAAQHPYLPRLFKQAGYETAAFVSSFVLRRETGLGDGFDSYDQGPEQGGGEAERSGAETVRAAVDWLRGRAASEARSERPVFLFVHLYDPHAPYRPAEPFASRYEAEPYDGEIAATDAAVGTLLDELKRSGIYDEAVVVFLSDHGEALGEHGEAQHGVFLYRETLQVPLLIKLPGGARGGETVAEPAQLADVAPTLLALTGRPVPAEIDGLPLLGPESGAGPAKTPRRIYAETFYPRLHLGWSELASLIEDRFHYIHGPTPELFDLVADPGQTRNLLDQERRVYAALRQAIDAYPRELAAPAAVDEETVRKLAALGYAAGGGRTSDGPLPDPRTQRDVLRDLEAAKAEISEERWAGAAEILQGLVARKPDLLDGWFTLALCLERLDRPEDTLAAYQRALEISGGDPRYALPVARQLFRMGRLDEAAQHAELAAGEGPGEAHEILAAVALSQGDADEALARMRRAGKASEAFRRDLGRLLAERGRTAEALEVMQGTGPGGNAPNTPNPPSDPATLNTMALALTDSGQHAQAAEVLGRVLALDPNNARAHELLGMISLRMGQPRQARTHLERALAINRRLPSAWNTLGVALFQLEGPDAALRAWREALALDGTQYDALLNIGLVAAQAGRTAEAREALRRFVDTAPPQRFGPDIQKAQRLLREIGG